MRCSELKACRSEHTRNTNAGSEACSLTSAYLPFYLPICLSICRSTCLSICLTTYRISRSTLRKINTSSCQSAAPATKFERRPNNLLRLPRAVYLRSPKRKQRKPNVARYLSARRKRQTRSQTRKESLALAIPFRHTRMFSRTHS